MTTYNTGNPLGSSDPRDLYDNAENLDEAANSSADTFQDRLGKSRLTWAGIVKSGSGDPAIAVDAAARAESAASSVEQDAEQIAQDAAQQAASAVIAGVDGQVAVAESAANRAETARDAAFVNADVYPDVAAGLAAVAVGEQFQVVSGDEVVRYLNDSASAVEVARYPSARWVEDLYLSGGDLLRIDRAHLFPDANLSVRRYLPDGSTTDYGAGYSQTAVAGGLRVEVPSVGTSGASHYLYTGISRRPMDKVTFEFSDVVSPGSPGVGYLAADGSHVQYVISGSGVVRKIVGGVFEDLAPAPSGFVDGDTVRVEADDSEVVFYVNDVQIHVLTLEDPFGTELLIGQFGFPVYTVKLMTTGDPIRRYVSEELAPVNDRIDAMDANAVTQSQLEVQANNLFLIENEQLFPDADLEVRRYLTNGSFNDYSGGYSQTAVADGLSVAIPAVGSTATIHYLMSGEVYTGVGRMTATFDIVTGRQSVGIGYINTVGDCIAYTLSATTAVVRKYENHDAVEDVYVGGTDLGYGSGSTLSFELRNGELSIHNDGAHVYTHTLEAGEFAGELVIAQSGFPEYVVSFQEVSDPVRTYVKDELTAAGVGGDTAEMYAEMYVELVADDKMVVYTRSPSGKYVGYPITHVVNEDRNYDCWQFAYANEFTISDSGATKTGRFPSDISGRTLEGPWKEYPGATDFISGPAHGDENTQSLILEIDGKRYDPTADNLFTSATSVRFVVDSILHSNITPGEDVARRVRVYDFDGKGFSLDMQHTFFVERGFTLLYHNAFSHTSYPNNLFTSYYIDQEYQVNQFDGVEVSHPGDYREFTLLGDDVSARVTVQEIDVGEFSPRILAAATGKLYFDLVNGAGGMNLKTAQAGDFWRIKSRYEISVP